jgi:hypothetical protein
MCFTLRLHTSAAPPRGGLTQALGRMTDDEINQLLEEHRKYGLPDLILERELSLALVASGDPMFLLKVPEPWRTRVVQFGQGVKDQWFEISNNGIVDYSMHADSLNALVVTFLHEVPIGQHIDLPNFRGDLP